MLPIMEALDGLTATTGLARRFEELCPGLKYAHTSFYAHRQIYRDAKALDVIADFRDSEDDCTWAGLAKRVKKVRHLEKSASSMC